MRITDGKTTEDDGTQTVFLLFFNFTKDNNKQSG
jgi:hypothetical protein